MADDRRKKETAVAAGSAAAAGGAALVGTKIPEHSHYSKETRKLIRSLPAGVHEVDTKALAKRPRKLGARKQQKPYVAAMAKERPQASFNASPVPVTRYRDGVIQRDNAHSVMANAMKGRKTKIKIEDAPGYRPRRRTSDELVRRAQMKYQERRLKRNFNLGDDKIDEIASKYKAKSRKKNTAKRPHGVVEDSLKYAEKPFNIKRAVKAGKNLSIVAKADRKRDQAAGAAGTAGAVTLAATPVRRSAAKVKIKDGKVSAKDAKKILNPGYRPGNNRAIRNMSRNLGDLENKPTKVIRYKDGTAIPWDGNHRATARVARGDKKIPVEVIEGKNRPAVSVTRNVYHSSKQKLHARRMDKGVFDPGHRPWESKKRGKVYDTIANGSKARSQGTASFRSLSGPSTAALRTKQAGYVGAGAGLIGTAVHLSKPKERKVSKRNLSQEQINRRKKVQAATSITTGTLGLTALGLLGAGSKRVNPKIVAVANKLPAKPKAVITPKLNGAALKQKSGYVATTGAGIGGVGAYNFASYTGAEARQRKRKVSKSAFGVEH